jgi:signal transduction histidine kinase
MAATVELAAIKPRTYYPVHVARILLLLLVMPYIAAEPQIPTLLASAMVATICLYEPYPWNLGLGIAVVVVSVAVRLASLLAVYRWPAGAAVSAQNAPVVSGLVLAALGAQYIRRREELIEARKDVKRLDSTVIGLTRANLRYQDFASEAEELAMETERKRITRDIHDVVGYTLTNNIMLMEAATDMMERNPFGVPALIATARENAQDGLEQIREALYTLRRQKGTNATGLRALAHMVRIYERATGVRVQTGFGTAGWHYPEEVDSAIYHLAQEALMNSFRHGKARLVTLIVAERAEDIAITVRDDGVGARTYTEGIGLRGMRERLERVGGSIRVDGQGGGFVVRATIPLNGGSSGGG